MAKYVDDILMGGLNHSWIKFARNYIESEFELSQFSISPDTLSVNSTEVEHNSENIVQTTREYSKCINPIF